MEHVFAALNSPALLVLLTAWSVAASAGALALDVRDRNWEGIIPNLLLLFSP